MGMMSKRKGRTGEQELARYLSDNGHQARRGRQYKGDPDAPDIHCPSIPFHIECKRVERFNAYAALEQAEADADGPALVAHRRNCKPWLAIHRLDDLLALVQ
jgi:Holliday junction resolvase